MRIAHVTDCYLPRLGGIETQVRDLAVRQAAAGHRVDVITATSSPTADAGDVTVHRASRGVAQAVTGNYDVLHVHLSMFSPFGLDVAREATVRGIPVAATMHSLWGNWEQVLAATRPLVRWHRRPVAWSAVSTVAARPLRERLGLDVAVVPNGVDVPWWAGAATARPEAALDPSPLRVVSVMRLCRRKRPAPLVQSVADVQRIARREGTAGVHLTIVGDGPAGTTLRRRVTADRLPVTFTGALPREAVRDVVGAQDLYVAPAPLESFGIAAVEARSAGLPVVGRAGSGLTDFVRDGVDGVLVGSDEEITATLAGLCREPDRLAALRREARATPPPIGWPRTLTAYDDLYASARSRAAGVVSRRELTRSW